MCTETLRSNTLPAQWTKAISIFIHNTSDLRLPEKSRPIILEPVSLKYVRPYFESDFLLI